MLKIGKKSVCKRRHTSIMLTCSAIIAADLLTVEELPIMKNIVLRSLLTRMINIKITGGLKSNSDWTILK